MGTALIRIKIMPSSPEVNLDEIQETAKKVIETGKGERVVFNIEPIAFGLNAVIASFDIDEENELEPVENSLREIENVNSAEIIDMRRAFG